jgi:hypothetical protein
MKNFLRKSILILTILSLSSSVFAKETIKLPDEVQAKIKSTKETKTSWYIRKASGAKAGKVLYGPFENKNQAIAVWFYLDLKPKKDSCIAQKEKFITNNPADFYKEDSELIKTQIEKFGKDFTVKAYFGLASFPAEEEKKETVAEVQTESVKEPENQEAVNNSNDFDSFSSGSDDSFASSNDFGSSDSFGSGDSGSFDSFGSSDSGSSDSFSSNDFGSSDSFGSSNDFGSSDSFGTNEFGSTDSFSSSNDFGSNDSFGSSNDFESSDSFGSSNDFASSDSFGSSENFGSTDSFASSDNSEKNQVTSKAPAKTESTTSSSEKNNPPAQSKTPQVPDNELPQTQNEVDFVIPQTNQSLERYHKEYLQDFAPKEEIPSPYDETEIEEYIILNPNEKDNKGCTLLMKAAESGNNWELNALIKSGADVNLTDNDGWTALMYAVRYQQNITIVNTLLAAGAKVKVKNNYNLSPLMLASTYNNNPEIITRLLSYYSVSEKEVLQSFILLLSDNSSSEYAKIAKVEAFIKKSVPLNSFYEGKTPLMYAAEFGTSTKLIKYLIDEGASPSIRSIEGKTAYDYAINNKALVHDENFWALNQK